MLAYYGTKISEHMTDTPEGYLICWDVPIARTGEMTYRAAELERSIRRRRTGLWWTRRQGTARS